MLRNAGCLGLETQGKSSARSTVPGGCLCIAQCSSLLVQLQQHRLQQCNLQMQRTCCLAAAGNRSPLWMCKELNIPSTSLCFCNLLSPFFFFSSVQEVVYTMLSFGVEDKEPAADLQSNCLGGEGHGSEQHAFQNWQVTVKGVCTRSSFAVIPWASWGTAPLRCTCLGLSSAP